MTSEKKSHSLFQNYNFMTESIKLLKMTNLLAKKKSLSLIPLFPHNAPGIGFRERESARVRMRCQGTCKALNKNDWSSICAFLINSSSPSMREKSTYLDFARFRQPENRRLEEKIMKIQVRKTKITRSEKRLCPNNAFRDELTYFHKWQKYGISKLRSGDDTWTRVEASFAWREWIVHKRNSVFSTITHDVGPQISSFHLLDFTQILHRQKEFNLNPRPQAHEAREAAGAWGRRQREAMRVRAQAGEALGARP